MHVLCPSGTVGVHVMCICIYIECHARTLHNLVVNQNLLEQSHNQTTLLDLLFFLFVYSKYGMNSTGSLHIHTSILHII